MTTTPLELSNNREVERCTVYGPLDLSVTLPGVSFGVGIAMGNAIGDIAGISAELIVGDVDDDVVGLVVGDTENIHCHN